MSVDLSISKKYELTITEDESVIFEVFPHGVYVGCSKGGGAYTSVELKKEEFLKFFSGLLTEYA